jgi:hypothetical protein
VGEGKGEENRVIREGEKVRCLQQKICFNQLIICHLTKYSRKKINHKRITYLKKILSLFSGKIWFHRDKNIWFKRKS